VSRPTETIASLVRAEVTHVVGLPDNTSGPLFPEVRRHPTVRLVTVTREGEAFALAAGLWLGGASPLVVIQNTGLLESGDAIRGTIVRMGAPVPVIVTGRGYAKMARIGWQRGDPLTRDLLIRPDVDSAALLTEATLEAWGIPYEACDEDDDPAQAVARTIDRARSAERPAVLILTRALT
jgi:sulfopyruvate decarboxylase subunit alpha